MILALLFRILFNNIKLFWRLTCWCTWQRWPQHCGEGRRQPSWKTVHRCPCGWCTGSLAEKRRLNYHSIETIILCQVELTAELSIFWSVEVVTGLSQLLHFRLACLSIFFIPINCQIVQIIALIFWGTICCLFGWTNICMLNFVMKTWCGNFCFVHRRLETP